MSMLSVNVVYARRTIYSIDATLPLLFEVIKIIYFDCEFVGIDIYDRRC